MSMINFQLWRKSHRSCVGHNKGNHAAIDGMLYPHAVTGDSQSACATNGKMFSLMGVDPQLTPWHCSLQHIHMQQSIFKPTWTQLKAGIQNSKFHHSFVSTHKSPVLDTHTLEGGMLAGKETIMLIESNHHSYIISWDTWRNNCRMDVSNRDRATLRGVTTSSETWKFTCLCKVNLTTTILNPCMRRK